MPINLTAFQKSALLEAGNIGSGHAAMALSQLMDKKIMVTIPAIQIATLGGLGVVIESESKIYTHISHSVMGDVKGLMVFTLDRDMARMMCDIVTGEKGEIGDLCETEISVLQEVGSILSSSYLNAVGDMTGMNITVSVSQYFIGEIESIQDMLKQKDINISGDCEVFCIRTEFVEAETKIDGYLILVMDNNHVSKLIKALGV